MPLQILHHEQYRRKGQSPDTSENKDALKKKYLHKDTYEHSFDSGLYLACQ